MVSEVPDNAPAEGSASAAAASVAASSSAAVAAPEQDSMSAAATAPAQSLLGTPVTGAPVFNGPMRAPAASSFE
eukprot:9916655-Lingulodinium_polyedra.AAC.1